jgi:hypothetical protein
MSAPYSQGKFDDDFSQVRGIVSTLPEVENTKKYPAHGTHQDMAGVEYSQQLYDGF